MLAQESRNFEAVLLGRRCRTPTLIVKVATGAFDCWRNARSPCAACFNRTAGSCVIGHVWRWFAAWFDRWLTDVQADIGGQTLEESAGIAGLFDMTILRRL